MIKQGLHYHRKVSIKYPQFHNQLLFIGQVMMLIRQLLKRQLIM